MKAYLAVDPGVSGALALYAPEDSHLSVVRDFKDIHDIVRAAVGLVHLAQKQNYDVDGVIEAVHSMPRQGVKSMFTFGRATGTAYGALEALSIGGFGTDKLHEVSPQRWQNWFKNNVTISVFTRSIAQERYHGHDPEVFDSRVYALQLFPKYEPLFKRGKDHNTGDAVCMAYYLSKLPYP